MQGRLVQCPRGSLGPQRFLELVPPPSEVDTVRVAFLRIDFLADRGGSLSSGTGRFNLDPSDTLENPVDRPPHNLDFYKSHALALEKYFDAQSYGRVRVEIDVWPAEQDSAYHLTDMADLGPWRFGNSIFRAAVDMMRLAFFAADSQSIAKSDRVPWNKYDRFMIIHAGSDLQSDLRADSKEDIPSFTMFVDDTDRVIFPDSINRARPIDRVAFIPETINQDQSYGAINGVIAHENGHNFFGFGDIYDINSALPVVGYWSLMDSGNLVGARVQSSTGEIFAVGLLPPSIDPFQRNFILDAGLLNYRQPGSADTAAFPLMGSQRHNDFVKVDLSSDEYVILENRFLSPAAAVRLLQDSVTRVVLGPREPDSLEYDALLPGGGVLAWHVDESVIPFTTSLRVNPDFGFNSNQRRLGLQIIEADALDDLAEAITLLDRTPFERARTELSFGMRLSGAAKVGDGRRHLTIALDLFASLGARLWADVTRAELRAIGAPLIASDRLTPREEQVARLVAGGASNHDVADSLYVNPKTVEYHLVNVYRKLGVRTRTELALVWRDDPRTSA